MMKNWHRGLLAAGAFLILLGAVHVVVQIIDPRDWESAVGWRKPILFGISTGVTLVSLAWVCTVVNRRSADLIGYPLAVLAVAEVCVITVQTWRSVPAHFNDGAALDRLLINSVDAMLIFITAAIFYYTYLALITRTAAPEWLAAVRGGMIFLALACVLGFGTAIYGNLRIAAGLNPQLIEPRGVPKFVHGIALHAIQILPIWVFVAGFFNSNSRRRQTSVWLISSAITFVTFYAFWQTINGWGRFELNVIGNLLLCGAGMSILGAILIITRSNESIER